MADRSNNFPGNWTREQLLLAINLYCRIPFGRQHSRAPEVIELAGAIGRSANSVAMKLNNFTSLDPKERARGVTGLVKVSHLDRQVWEEFQNDWEKLAVESEELWVAKLGATDEETIKPPAGPTEGQRVAKVRYAQNFFRRTVLASYGMRCCITRLPIPELLIASHILPWSKYPEHRVDPRNGLCLSRLHDGAFDQGLITFDEQNRLVLSRRLKDHLPDDSLRENFLAFEGAQLHLPEKFQPMSECLAKHREEIFLD